MSVITARAVAYLNYGRWVADCPRRHCANAIKLDPRQSTFHCGGVDGCRVIADVHWPDDADDLWAALDERPVPGTRNWAPAGHRQALATGHPHGQTAAELRAETRDYEED